MVITKELSYFEHVWSKWRQRCWRNEMDTVPPPCPTSVPTAPEGRRPGGGAANPTPPHTIYKKCGRRPPVSLSGNSASLSVPWFQAISKARPMIASHFESTKLKLIVNTVWGKSQPARRPMGQLKQASFALREGGEDAWNDKGSWTRSIQAVAISVSNRRRKLVSCRDYQTT